uniref:Uncharacterized protein n=1 Tax=Arundo donax TaxID=35708 RepID=A0A0A9B3Y0_ARUDO
MVYSFLNIGKRIASLTESALIFSSSLCIAGLFYKECTPTLTRSCTACKDARSRRIMMQNSSVVHENEAT